MAGTALVPSYSALLKTCQELHRKAYITAAKGVLDFYWDLGSEINRALGEERGAYGDATVSRLSDDLHLGKSTIYNSISLATKFGRSDISPQVPWSHYCALLPLSTETAKTLAKKTEEKSLTLPALKAEIVKVREKRYVDRPERFAGARMLTALNPLSGIPGVGALKDMEIKEIDEGSLGRIKKRIEAAEEKIGEIREFVGGLKVVAGQDGGGDQGGSKGKKRATKKMRGQSPQ